MCFWLGLEVLRLVNKKAFFYNYVWTYDLYGPAHKDFDAGGWKSRVLWAPVKLHEPIGECNLGPTSARIKILMRGAV
jgi:hypothetical protein